MQLQELLRQLHELLRKHGVNTWAKRINEIYTKVGINEDTSTVAELKALFQGAGTLDDLVILRSNGHLIDEKEEKKANQHLGYLIQEIKSFLA